MIFIKSWCVWIRFEILLVGENLLGLICEKNKKISECFGWLPTWNKRNSYGQTFDLGSRAKFWVARNLGRDMLHKRNKESETPLFLAVRHGKKDAFLWLYKMCADNPAQALDYCQASHGITALHIAIANGYSGKRWTSLIWCLTTFLIYDI